MTRFRSSLAASFLAGTLLVAGGCADVPSGSAPLAASGMEKIAAPAGPARSLSGDAVVSKVIGVAGGELATASGHRIVFPAGAVAHPTQISIRDDGRFVGVHLEPHGLQFPVGRGPTLTLNISGADIAGYQTLNIVYVGADGQILEVLPTTVSGSTAVSRLQHFSGYLLSGG